MIDVAWPALAQTTPQSNNGGLEGAVLRGIASLVVLCV